MITSLGITSLNQGQLFGEKPTIDQLLANGAIIEEGLVTKLGCLFGRLFSVTLLAWSNLFNSGASDLRV
jgi:hypothetical protein